MSELRETGAPLCFAGFAQPSSGNFFLTQIASLANTRDPQSEGLQWAVPFSQVASAVNKPVPSGRLPGICQNPNLCQKRGRVGVRKDETGRRGVDAPSKGELWTKCKL